jgi:hypothetical protein
MKLIKASEARKQWFRILDDALRGEIIAVERKGQRVVLQREEPSRSARTKDALSYKKLLKVRRPDEADRWTWDWRPDRGLEPHTRDSTVQQFNSSRSDQGRIRKRSGK